MATRGVAMTIQFVAWDTSANAGKTGDAANITPRWVKDGTIADLTTATVTELDATNAPGLYKCSISATEADCDIGTLCGKSSTANISIVPTTIQFERLPNAAPDSAGGLPISDAGGLDLDALNTNVSAILSDTGTDGVVVAAGSKTGYSLTATTGLGNQTADITGNLSGSVGSVTGAVGSVTGAVGSVGSGGITAASFGAGAIDAAALAADAGNEIADAVLSRNVSNVEGTAGEHTLCTVVLAMLENSISGTTLTILRTDGVTTHATKTLTTNASAEPITGIA